MNLKILGTLEDGRKKDVAEYLIQALNEKFPDLKGELYLGYPIYVDEVANRRTCVDMALMPKTWVKSIECYRGKIEIWKKCPVVFKNVWRYS